MEVRAQKRKTRGTGGNRRTKETCCVDSPSGGAQKHFVGTVAHQTGQRNGQRHLHMRIARLNPHDHVGPPSSAWSAGWKKITRLERRVGASPNTRIRNRGPDANVRGWGGLEYAPPNRTKLRQAVREVKDPPRQQWFGRTGVGYKRATPRQGGGLSNTAPPLPLRTTHVLRTTNKP